MNPVLRIVVAVTEPIKRQFIVDALATYGHEVIAKCDSRDRLWQTAESMRPELVITDVKLPSQDPLDIAQQIFEKLEIPVVIVSANYDPDVVAKANAAHIMAYLVQPTKQADIIAAVEIARGRFSELQSLNTEVQTLRKTLDDRKVIERAKGILMKQGNLDEAEAFRRLQQTARSSNRKMVDIAQMIIVSSNAMS